MCTFADEHYFYKSTSGIWYDEDEDVAVVSTSDASVASSPITAEESEDGDIYDEDDGFTVMSRGPAYARSSYFGEIYDEEDGFPMMGRGPACTRSSYSPHSIILTFIFN